jgi:NADH dehydrogenase FAD-containing subunit
VVIIGGGFGGLFCARRVGRLGVDVTLLDRAACRVFQPLLYQCATGTLSIGQISRSLREELANRRNVTTLLGEAIRLDAQTRCVTARRPDESTFDLDYDYLVIAAGMRQSYFGNEEFAAWAPGMKTLDDALSIRRRVFAAFEIAETLPPGPERDQWLTFVVTGAGPTGVELAGQIRELATRSLANEFLVAESDRSGRVSVEADLSVPGHPEVFVIGDLAGRDGLPGVAENAMQGGLHAAACIRRDLGSSSRKDFRYHDLGSAAYISRGHALLQAGPVKLTGKLGWLGWVSSTSRSSPACATASAPSQRGWRPSRANRSDRSFILGGSVHPEEPYTWESPVHQGHHSMRDDSIRAERSSGSA